ncbi:MAG: type II toxin-antitoxin system RelE/ParE family toxin [Acidobacteriota bacterium]|nr:type II toxin-antitoxin system RelE/ParE family toxin [Acidobacteriota bacterium]MDE3266452.1 type II toxin-antitoxin system RelE/ParE family toxin [Acidobacteriota bacterium]
MPFAVHMTGAAARDLEEIGDYIAGQDGSRTAQRVLNRIEETVQALSALPDRGSYPRELLDFGIREYREVFFKAYRIIYRVAEGEVYVLVIADGRRDMRALLERRLLGI